MSHGKDLTACGPTSLLPQKPPMTAQTDDITAPVSILPLKGNLLTMPLNNHRLEHSIVESLNGQKLLPCKKLNMPPLGHIFLFSTSKLSSAFTSITQL